MNAMTYQIETRGTDTADPEYGQWSTEYVGDGAMNEFSSVAEATAVVEELRLLGGNWADAEYRVTETKP